MMRPRSYYALPDLPEAGLLTRYRDSLAVIVPVARVNECTNPSFETNMTGWAATTNATIARTTAEQYHGAYSLLTTPTGGTNEGAGYIMALTSGQLYAISCKIKGVAGLPYAITVYLTGVRQAGTSFIGTGRWQWVWLYFIPASSTNYTIAILKDNHANTSPFYVDGVQIERIGAGETVSTYLDGSLAGLVPNQQPPACGWNGTPHASTSYRTQQTRAGGMIMRFRDLGFLLTTILGLSAASPSHIATPYAQLDGAYYQNTIKPPRDFTLLGRYAASSPTELDSRRARLAALLDRDLVATRQPLILTMQAEECGLPIGEAVSVAALYSGGLEGEVKELPAAAGQLTFTQFLPFIQGHDGGAELTVQQNVSNANGIMQRSPSGVWSALGTGVNANGVLALARGLDGKLYAGGDFTQMGGVANTARIAYWDGAWHAMGTGASSGTVLAILAAPDGNIYAVGTFASMGGVANTAGIARWNGSAWFAVGTGVSAGTVDVRALVYGQDGNVYATGYFTTMGGVANTSRIARWNGAAWSALSTGLDTGGEDLAIGPDGSIYVVGAFSTAGGGAAVRAARWNGSAWSALGSGLSALAQAVTTGPDGRVYAGGTFTTAGGVSANRIAVWNGASWSPLGSGADNTVLHLAFIGNLLYASGIFSTIGGVTTPDHVAAWNGTSWVPIGVDFPGSTSVNVFLLDRTSALTFGFSTNGTAVTEALTTATNEGSAAAYPILLLTGPASGSSRIYQLVNYTTGRAIYFNYVMTPGETAILILDPANLSLTSNTQGNLAGKVLPGSNEADFFLQPGANVISFFSADSTVTAVLSWQLRYADLGGALYQTAP